MGETRQHRDERLRRQEAQYPEFSLAEPDEVLAVERIRIREAREPTTFGSDVAKTFTKPQHLRGRDINRNGVIEPDEFGAPDDGGGFFDRFGDVLGRVLGGQPSAGVGPSVRTPQLSPEEVGDVAPIFATGALRTLEHLDRPRGAMFAAAERSTINPLDYIKALSEGFRDPQEFTGERILARRGVGDEPIVGDLSARDLWGGAFDFLFDPVDLVTGGVLAADLARPIIRRTGPILRDAAFTYRDVTSRIPIGLSVKDIGQAGDDPLEAARQDLLRRLRQQVRQRNIGETGAQIREGRFRQFDSLREALDEGRRIGLSGNALNEFARESMRGGALTTGPGRAQIPDAMVDTFYNRLVDRLNAGQITEGQYLNQSTALRELIRGGRQLQPQELRDAAMVLGPEAADLLNRSARPGIPPAPPRPRRGGAGLPSTDVSVPRGTSDPNIRPRTGLPAAARREQERLGAQLQREAAERIPQPLPTREFARPSLSRTAGQDLPSVPDRPAVERFRGAAAQAQQRAQQLQRAGERSATQFNRARTQQIAAANRLDAEALQRALPLEEWNLRAQPRTVDDRVRLLNAQRIQNALHEAVGLDDQQLMTVARELLAGQDSALSDEVMTAVEYWLDGNRRILDGMGPEGATWLSNATNVIRGDFQDPFLNAVLHRRSSLSTALRMLGMDEKQVRIVSNNLMRRELLRRFDGDIPQHILDALRRNTQEAYRASQDNLATWVAQAKNTQFGLLDIGVFGQQALVATTYGGVQGFASLSNRVAGLLGHPLVGSGPANLPRKVIYALDGVDQSVAAAVSELGTGSLLQHVPGFAGVDARISRVVDASTQFQFGFVLGNMRNAIYEGQLTISRLLRQDISDPAVRARAAGFANHITSTANRALRAGRAGSERTGLLSAAMTRSQVARVVDLLKLVSPNQPFDVRIAAATMIASYGAFMYGFGSWLNGWIGVGEFEANPLKPNSGVITLANGLTFSISPQRSFDRAIIKAVNALAGEDPQAAATAWGGYLLGRSSLPVRAVAAAAGWGYEPGYGYRFGDLTRYGALRNALPTPPIIDTIVESGFDLNDSESTDLMIGFEGLGFSTYEESAFSAEERALSEAGVDTEGMTRGERRQRLAEVGVLEASDAQRREELEDRAGRGDREAMSLLVSYQERDRLNALAAEVGGDRRAYRGGRAGIKAEQRGARSVFLDIYESLKDPEAKGDLLLNRYYELYEQATNQATGLLDGDALNTLIDEFRQDIGDSDWALLRDELNRIDPRDNPLEQELQQVIVAMEDSGLWEITDRSWQSIQDHPAFAEAVGGFDSYFDWRDSTVDALRERLIAGGMNPDLAIDEADDLMASNPIVKAMQDQRSRFRAFWVRDHVADGLVGAAVRWGYLQLNEKNEEIVRAFPGEIAQFPSQE